MADSEVVFRITAQTAEAKAAVNDLRSSMSNNFADISKVSEGALRGLNNQVSILARQVPVVGQPLSGITRALIDMGVRGTQETQKLNDAIKVFDSQSQKAFLGGTARADEFAKTFERLGVNTENALRQTRAEFGNLITGLSQIANEEDRLAAITEIFQGKTSAVLPVIEARIARTQAMAAVDVEAAAANEALAASEAEVGAGAAAAGGAMALLTNPLVLVGAAVVAVTAGIALVTKEMFGAADSAAHFGDEIFRASQRTKLSTEELSALRLAARENSAEFNTVVAGLSRYLRNLDEAANGNKKLAEEFRSLGINAEEAAKTPQAAINAFIAAFDRLGPSVEENQTAIKLLGKSGDQLIPTLRSLGGNIDQAVQHARQLNAVVGEEGAAAAHRLIAAEADLGAQTEGISRVFGETLEPAAVQTLTTVSNLLSDNREGFTLLSGVIAGATNEIVTDLQHIAEMAEIASGNLGQVYNRHFGDVKPEDVAAPAGVTAPEVAALPSASEIAKKSAVEAQAAAQATTIVVAGELNRQRALYEQHRITIQQYTAAREELAVRERDAVLASIKAEEDAVKGQTAKDEQERLKQEKELLDLDNKRRKALEDFTGKVRDSNAEMLRVVQEQADKERKADQETNNLALRDLQEYQAHRLRMFDEHAKGTLELIKRNEADQTFTHKQAEQERLKIERDRLELQKKQLERQLEVAKQYDVDSKAVLAVVNALQLLNAQIENFNNDYAPRVQSAILQDTKARLSHVEAILKENAALEKQEGLLKDLPDITPGFGKTFGGKYVPRSKELRRGDQNFLSPDQIKELNKDLGPPPPGPWQQFGDVVTHSLGRVVSAGQIMHDSLSAVFSGVGSGLQQMIVAFLTGERVSAKAFASMAKGAIAGVAAEAAVRALFELAMGVASLWIKPQEAAQHFLAAKLFGVVAAMGAAASLAIPGGGGAPVAAQAGFGSTSGGTSGTTSQQDRTIVEARRGGLPNPNQPREVHYAPITVKIGDHTLDTVIAKLYTKPTKTRDEAMRLNGYAPA